MILTGNTSDHKLVSDFDVFRPELKVTFVCYYMYANMPHYMGSDLEANLKRGSCLADMVDIKTSDNNRVIISPIRLTGYDHVCFGSRLYNLYERDNLRFFKFIMGGFNGIVELDISEVDNFMLDISIKANADFKPCHTDCTYGGDAAVNMLLRMAKPELMRLPKTVMLDLVLASIIITSKNRHTKFKFESDMTTVISSMISDSIASTPAMSIVNDFDIIDLGNRWVEICKQEVGVDRKYSFLMQISGICMTSVILLSTE